MKSTEEQKRSEYKDFQHSTIGVELTEATVFNYGFEAAIIFANTWYEFKDELPDHNERVNIKDIHGDVCSFVFTGNSNILESAKLMGIVYWKPIIIK
ncbi:MAG: hypothetical protein ACOYN4_05600 [Bacteroidales bacterium]